MVRGSLKHGHARGRNAGGFSPTYSSWAAMMNRCRNPKAVKWGRYGGRGISVCDAWTSFDGFLAAMGERPAGLTLDRIDVNGNYEPGNCRWATAKQQANNREFQRIDLSGQRFGRLVVCEFLGSDRHGPRWSLRCDCGSEHVATSSNLRCGRTKSCGCLKKGATA